MNKKVEHSIEQKKLAALKILESWEQNELEKLEKNPGQIEGSKKEDGNERKERSYYHYKK